MIFTSSVAFIFSLFYKQIGKKWIKMRQREWKIRSMLFIPVLIMVLLIVIVKKSIN